MTKYSETCTCRAQLSSRASGVGQIVNRPTSTEPAKTRISHLTQSQGFTSWDKPILECSRVALNLVAGSYEVAMYQATQAMPAS